eukprot:scaffold170391_cov30-Tisochrysis_lutea.AAC.4
MLKSRSLAQEKPLHATPQPGYLSLSSPRGGSARGSGSGASGAMPSTAPAAGVEPSTAARQLMEMGFSRAQAEGALEETNGDVSESLTKLLALAQGGGSPRGCSRKSSCDGSVDGPAISPAAAPPGRALNRGHTGRFEAPASLPPKVRTLVDMGFTAEQAAAALQQVSRRAMS